MDNKKVGKNDLNKYCAVLARDFPNAYELNSMARQACAERACLLSPDFTITARRVSLAKKDIHNFRKIAALLSTKQLDGNLRTIGNPSILPTRKGLGG